MTRTALFFAILLSGTSAVASDHTVSIQGMRYVPERLEVAPGDTVRWINKDIVPHTVTAKNAGIESGELAQGKAWKLVVRKKGEVDYVCRLHPGMRGVLMVR